MGAVLPGLGLLLKPSMWRSRHRLSLRECQQSVTSCHAGRAGNRTGLSHGAGRGPPAGRKRGRCRLSLPLPCRLKHRQSIASPRRCQGCTSPSSSQCGVACMAGTDSRTPVPLGATEALFQLEDRRLHPTGPSSHPPDKPGGSLPHSTARGQPEIRVHALRSKKCNNGGIYIVNIFHLPRDG